MDIIIRSAINEDLKVCEKLLDSPEFTIADGEKWKVELLKEYIDDNYFLVAELDNKVIGCIIGEKLKMKGSVIWLFVVEDKYRDHGIGSKLIEQFEIRAKAKGAKWILVYASLYDEGTVKFYKKHHFKVGTKNAECIELLGVNKI